MGVPSNRATRILDGPRLPFAHIRAALLVCIGYYIGARVGFALTMAPVPVSTLWPPNAILMAGLVLTPARAWPLVLGCTFVSHVAVQFQTGVPVSMILSWFLSNSAEALLGAWMLQRVGTHAVAFESIRSTTTFFLAAGLTAPFVSSFLDASLVMLNGWGTADYWTVWRTRFFSNVLANLTIVPVILTTANFVRELSGIRLWRFVEAATGMLALVGLCWVVFVRQEPGPTTSPALLFVPDVLLVAAAIRFGPWGAAVSVLTCALLAIWGAVLGQGPFITSSAAANARSIQFFLIVTWIPIMSLATVLRERARADAHARHSEAQLAMAIEAGQIGLWEWDVRTGCLTWSDITRRMYGVAPDAPVNADTFKDLIHPDDRQTLEGATMKALAGEPFEVEFRICFPGGGTKWILSKGRPVRDEDGRPVRLVGVKLDVSERRAAEMYIESQRRTLAQFSRVSVAGELSTVLAHEVNQPLAAILANASAARRYLRHDPPNLRELNEIVDAIANDNRRASAVITRFGKLRRKGDAPLTPVRINDLILSVVDVAHPDTLSREVAVTCQLADELPLVLGDALQLQQLLLNLVINACDAMEAVAPGSRRIVVSSETSDDGGVRVVVSDTGPGVADEIMDQIFEPFFTSKRHRLGLGLAICRSIVSSHDGRLSVQNQHEGGAAFSFRLPRCPTALQVPSEQGTKPIDSEVA